MERIGLAEIAVQQRLREVTSVKERQPILVFAAGVNGGLGGCADLRIPGIFIDVETGAVADQSGSDEAAAREPAKSG